MTTNTQETEKILELKQVSVEKDEEVKLTGSKKDISFVEVYQLIKKMNLEYNKNQTMEIIQELGIDQKKTIQLDNLIETSKMRRHSSKYANFYDNILNLFVTPSERIIKILEECQGVLRGIKKDSLVTDLDWVIKKIHNDDLYNINLDLINEINYLENNKSNELGNTEMESAMKFLAEYSSDAFTKSKKEDVKAAKSLSSQRMQNSVNQRTSNGFSSSRNYSLFQKEPLQYINNFALSPTTENRNFPKASVISLPMNSSPSSFLSNFPLHKNSHSSSKNFEVIKEEIIDNKNKRKSKEIKKEEDSSLHINDESEEESVGSNSQVSEKSQTSSDNEEENDNINNNFNLKGNGNKNIQGSPLFNNRNPLPQIGRMSICLYNKSHESERRNTNTISNITSTNSIDDIDFNLFEYSETFGRENVLINLSDYIFDKYQLYCIINSKRFETFLDKIRVGYDYLLPYHNDLHASDVLQTVNIFSIYSNLKSEMDLTSLDIAGLFIACIIHDFKHPGLNNTYHINKRTSIATKYNDISVLENYHLSAAFKIISHPNSNIFCDLSIEEYRVVRKRIVECVLATDMAKHTKSQTSLKIKIDQFKNNTPPDKILQNFINNNGIEETKFDRQQEILNYLIHAADISNPGKKFPISKIWTDLVMEEFFLQGDLERKDNLPISFLCDRNTTNVPKSQIMFISNIILPCFKILCAISPPCGVFIQNMYDNIENWKKLEEEKRRLSLENK